MTSLTRLLSVLLSALALTLTVGVGTGHAHAALAASNPVDGSQIDTAPDAVVLTFNEPIESTFAALTVTGPDGTRFGAPEPTANRRDLTLPLDGLGAAGEYTVAFRVVSADGHPIAGTYPFTLTGSAEPITTAPTAPTSTGNTAETPSTATTPESTPTATAADDETAGFPAWIPVVAVVVLLAVGVAVALRPRNRRR